MRLRLLSIPLLVVGISLVLPVVMDWIFPLEFEVGYTVVPILKDQGFLNVKSYTTTCNLSVSNVPISGELKVSIYRNSSVYSTQYSEFNVMIDGVKVFEVGMEHPWRELNKEWFTDVSDQVKGKENISLLISLTNFGTLLNMASLNRTQFMGEDIKNMWNTPFLVSVSLKLVGAKSGGISSLQTRTLPLVSTPKIMAFPDKIYQGVESKVSVVVKPSQSFNYTVSGAGIALQGQADSKVSLSLRPFRQEQIEVNIAGTSLFIEVLNETSRYRYSYDSSKGTNRFDEVYESGEVKTRFTTFSDTSAAKTLGQEYRTEVFSEMKKDQFPPYYLSNLRLTLALVLVLVGTAFAIWK